jgi:hypothetical protein
MNANSNSIEERPVAMKSVKFVIAALGLVAASVVLAENLVTYATTSGGTVHYYDTESIKHNANIATVWTYWDQSKNKSVKERYSRVKIGWTATVRNWP